MSERVLSKKSIYSFVVFYSLIVICDLIGSSDEIYNPIRYFTKPSILGALLIFSLVYKTVLPKSTYYILFLALVFSLSGDVLLLFSGDSKEVFIAGLASFLIAHMMYIFIFVKKKNEKLKKRYTFIVSIVLGGLLFSLLYSRLAEMLIPVGVYMVVILIMFNAAYLRKDIVSRDSFNLVFVGAMFFMLSDSLLAINMFYKQFFLGNVFIMFTYAIAQFLIVYGVLKQEENRIEICKSND